MQYNTISILLLLWNNVIQCQCVCVKMCNINDEILMMYNEVIQ